MMSPRQRLKRIGHVITRLERMAETTTNARQAEVLIEATVYLTLMELVTIEEIEEIAA